MIFETKITKRIKRPIAILCIAGSILVTIGILVSVSNTISPSGIVIHHSAVPFNFQANPNYVDTIDEIHRRRGFGIFYWGRIYHIGYHYLILPDGSLVQGRPENAVGAHTKGHNNFIGICLIGDFSNPDNQDETKGPLNPTDAQKRTLVKTVDDLRSKYNIGPDKVYAHKDLDPTTECPGENLLIKNILDNGQ